MKNRRRLCMESFESRCLLDGTPVISEFLAVNNALTKDNDGDYSDWIEVHNPDTTSLDLTGWYLTDDRRDLTKWRFPATTIPPLGYELVYASDKNRVDPAQPLHTNFRLSGTGEYLALVRPDGATVAYEYAPTYPSQIDDLSYGALAVLEEKTLLAANAPARAIVPANDSLGNSWIDIGFNDNTWTQGTTGVGYSLDGDLAEDIGLDLRTAMSGVNTSAYVRIPFELTNPDDLVMEQLSLAMKYDDGFVAYLNGQPILARNAPGGGESPANGLVAYYPFENSLSDAASDYLNNTGTGDNDLSRVGGSTATFLPGQVGQAIRIGDTANDPVRLTAPNQADFNLGGQFTVEAWIYPTDITGWGRLALLWDGSGKNSIHFAMRNGTQLSVFHVDEAGIQTNLESPFNTIDLGINDGWQHVAVVGDGTRLRLYHNGIEVSAGPGGVQPVPSPVNYSGTTKTSAANLGIGDSAAIPTAANAYKGLMDEVAIWKVALTPDQIASHFNSLNAGYGLTPVSGASGLAWNSAALTDRAEDEDGLEYDVFDITHYKHLLQTGTNVLAIHGLNSAANNDDFIVLPELRAGSHVLQPTVVGYLESATPGEPNATSFQGLVADIDFSVERGYYDQPFDLTLSTTTPGVTIRYTMDGSVPTETNGLNYAGPIAINTTATIRAAAFRTGYRPSPVTTHTYLYLDRVLTQTNTAPPGSHWDTEMDPNVVNLSQTYTVREGLVSVPTLSIVMDPNDLFGTSGIYRNSEARGDAWVRPGSVEFFYPDEYDGYRVGDGFATTSGVRVAGIFSRLTSNPKHSLRLSFQDRFGPSKLEFPLFENSPMTRFDNLVVLNGHNQSWATGISNALYLRDQVSRDLQQLRPDDVHVHGMYVNLYLNGQYWGQYNLTERPDDQFAAENFGGSKEEYDVLKGVRFGETPLAALVSGTRDAWEAMFAIADRDMSDPVNYQAIQQYVDIDQLIDYNIGILYTGDRDGPTGIVAGQSTPKNFYGVRRRTADGRFRFFAWDAEFTFEDSNVDVSERQGSQNPGRLHYQLRQNAEYRLRFADHVHQWFFNDGPMTAENVAEKFAARAEEIDKSIVAESARWGDSKREPPYRRDIEWVNELNRVLNSVIPARHNVILNQFRADGLYPDVAAPELTVNGLDQHGGTISATDQVGFAADGATVYYTLDGTDPRVGTATIESQTPVSRTSPAKAFVPRDGSLGDSWKLPGFNDTNWSAGTAAVGFDRGTEYTGLLGLNINSPSLPANQRIDSDGNGANDNNSVFVRVPFQVADASRIDSMKLDMTYDDGFVAYLNGHEVARANAPAEEEWNSSAVQDRSGPGQVMIAISYSADNRITIYRNGQVYAPAANASLGTLQPYTAGVANILLGLRHEDLSGSTGTRNGPDGFFAGAINEARVYNTSLVTADIEQLFAAGPLVGNATAPNDTRLKHLWSFNSNANDQVGTAHGTLRNGALLEGGRLVLDGINDYMSSAPINSAISAKTLVAWVTVDNLEQQAGSVLTIQNSAGNDLFDGIVFGERVPRQWMAGSNNFLRSVANNTGGAETVAGGQTLVPISLDLSQYAQHLVTGTNVLAIQAMSHNATTANMLVAPTLQLAETTSTGVSPTALVFGNQISIAQSTRIKARVLSSGEWSALTDAVFTVPVEGLRISEVMFHPADATAPSAWTDEDFEYIELYNAGPSSIALSQLRFSDGIEFDFSTSSATQLAPGAYALVVSNQVAFAERYGTNRPVIGQYTGRLANTGELVTLADRFGTSIIELTYADNWYSHTDGGGYSLTLLDLSRTQQSADDDDQWRPSQFSGGSPGTGDTDVTPRSIVVNEIFAHPVTNTSGRWIELRNTTGQSINIGLWYVSNSDVDRRKYQIPAGTTLGAGEYLLLSELTHFGPSSTAPGRRVPWELSPSGGTVFLTGGNASGELLGYRIDRTYDAAEPDVSLGVYTKPDGSTDFVRLTASSPGTVNRAPIVGPLVINELMYHPQFGDVEFIELHNISNAPVPLDDGQGRSWRLRGAIDYTFPAGRTISAGGYALIMQAADGADQTASATAFRSRYQIPANVDIFIYTDALNGSLSNDEEKLFLDRPEPTLSASTPTYLVIDAVRYSDTDPWPLQADGTGSSLSRFVPSAYGNDVGNWVAGTLRGTPGKVNTVIDTSPPTTPTGLSGSIISSNEVWLTWNFASDAQSGVASYRVYRDGAVIGTTPIPAWRDSVTFSTNPFTYHVTALNADGFESSSSNLSQVGGTTVRLQDGLNAYQGTRDATIRQQNATTNYGTTESIIEIDGEDGGFDKFGLLRWDLTGAVPANATLLSASVSLEVVDPTSGTYGVFDLRRDWVEDQVTWNQFATGGTWATPGGSGVTDRGTTPLATWSAGAGAQTLVFNATGLGMIRDWLRGAVPNFGVIIADTNTTDGLDFASRESTIVGQRPALNLMYIPPTVTAVAGDVNRDRVVNAADIDLLMAAVRHNVADRMFDLDGNSSVNSNDLAHLIDVVLGTSVADANLDGAVDASDFNAWNANKFSAASVGWAQGDFDGDRRADATDFNLWLGRRFTAAADRSLTARVPRAAHDTSSTAMRTNELPVAAVVGSSVTEKVRRRTQIEGNLTRRDATDDRR